MKITFTEIMQLQKTSWKLFYWKLLKACKFKQHPEIMKILLLVHLWQQIN